MADAIDFATLRAAVEDRLTRHLTGHEEPGCNPGWCTHAPSIALLDLLAWCDGLREPGAPLFWPEMGYRIELRIAEALRVAEAWPVAEPSTGERLRSVRVLLNVGHGCEKQYASRYQRALDAVLALAEPHQRRRPVDARSLNDRGECDYGAGYTAGMSALANSILAEVWHHLLGDEEA